MKARLYCLLFFFITSITAYAETFTVTSNADSGPGTLRAALTSAAANGILLNDLIKFELPGNTETDRTILLLNELPFVTRGIVLDATTQPGPTLGSSPAKVLIRANRLVYQASAYDYGCFNIISTIDVEIYGFAFDQFESLKVSTNPNGQGSAAAAIYVRSSSGITIGAPGKGNVFMQNDHGINGDTENYIITNAKLKVQSNWFGLNSNGMEIDTKGYYYARVLANNSEFGGPDLTYANSMAGYSPWGVVFQGTNFNVRFNRFGYLGDGTMANRVVSIAFNTTQSEFTDNQATRFVILCQGKQIKILRNKEYTTALSTANNRIELYYAENIQIGNDNLADANEFLKNDFGPIANFGSKNVEVRKNIIHCTPYAYGIVDIVAPAIQVLINTASEYSGTAAPNSEVYIYNDYTDCASCSPLQFYTKLIADAVGKWGITGDFSTNKFIANTTLVNVSSEFTQPHILTGSSGYWYNKKDPTCGESNGTLELTKTAHLLKIEWYNANNEKVGEGMKVEHLPPGEYYAKGYNGKCYTVSPYRANLFNVEPKIVATGLNYKHPGCGLKNGYIKGLYYSINGGAAVTYKWINENNEVMTSGNTDLNNAGPGSYTFVVSTLDGCATSYGPILLENTDGPNIDRTTAVPTNAHCDLSDGSIVGAKATGIGNIKFTWKDENNITVRETADLIHVKAGKYTLEVKDESACGVVSTSFELFADNNISIDEQLVSSIKATCGKSNGAITKMNVSGANTIKWYNENDELVGTDIELTAKPAGKYKLVASNGYCSKTSSVFMIEEANNNLNYTSTKQVKPATCSQDNGHIILTFNQATPKSFRWLDASEHPVNGTTSIGNLPPGFYRLYIRDENDCESLYDTYEITAISPPIINESPVKVEDDACGLKTGSITGLNVSGGTAPFRYEWRDQANALVGSNPELINVAAGTYTMQVFDSNDCSIQSSPFNIAVKTSFIAAPNILPVQICAAGKAMIVPDQIKEGKYLLYESLTAMQPISTTRDVFNIQVDKTETYFVSYANGICESNRVPVLIEVAENSLKIANAFSPNNDGVNDTWKIEGLRSYPEFELKIYNRNGQNIFSTRDPQFVFDGRHSGSNLPVGVYYYVLKLRTGCSTLNGSLTILK